MTPLAQDFLSTVNSFIPILESAPEAHVARGLSADTYSRAGLMSPSQQQSSHYLFVRPAGGDENLRVASCELFDIVCEPFHRQNSRAPVADNQSRSAMVQAGPAHSRWPLPSWPMLLGTGNAAEQLLSQMDISPGKMH